MKGLGFFYTDSRDPKYLLETSPTFDYHGSKFRELIRPTPEEAVKARQGDRGPSFRVWLCVDGVPLWPLTEER